MVSPCTSLLCYKIDHVHTMTHNTAELKKEGNWFPYTRLPLTVQAERMCNEKNTATSKDKKNIYSRGWRKWQKNIATVFFILSIPLVLLAILLSHSTILRPQKGNSKLDTIENRLILMIWRTYLGPSYLHTSPCCARIGVRISVSQFVRWVYAQFEYQRNVTARQECNVIQMNRCSYYELELVGKCYYRTACTWSFIVVMQREKVSS